MSEPRTTYQDAIERLNARSLRNSLEVCSLFSCLEFIGGDDSPLFPMLNNEVVRAFGEAIIKSKAAWYKDRDIRVQDLPTLLNGAKRILDDPRLSKEVISGGERKDMLFKLQTVFSRMAYVQIRPQQSPTIATGQFLAVAEILPRDNWREFPESLQTVAAGFPDVIISNLGATLKELLVINQAVVSYFASRGDTAIRRLPIGQVSIRDQARLLRSIFEELNPYLNEFRLELKHLENVFGRTLSTELGRYASVYSRSIREHREILEHHPYQVGLEGLRLSSLDRFPLIDGEVPGIWYVPNVRTLARAGSDILHFTLNEVCKEHYERIRGASLELYLHKMVTERAPNLTVVSEGKWLTPKGEVAGPDLLVIDHRDPPCILAIEVKFRKMLPGTRFDLSPEDLGYNYAGLWKALLLLPAKLEGVFNMHGDYAAYASDLKVARDYRRWYVGLAGEAPYAFGELSHYLGETSPDFPLHGFTEPWTAMSIETFERLVEVMVQHGRALGDVVDEYRSDCRNLELSLPRADMFRNAELDEQESYAAKCLLA